MFTGLIQSTGKVLDWKPQGRGGRLTLKSDKKLSKVQLGESIAVNGCCLTVVSHKSSVLAFDVSEETLTKTALGEFKKNTLVNLERAMSVDGRFGGHLVLGHVDATGKILQIQKQKSAWVFTVQFPKAFSKLLIEKGSVCVDGISLTVCDLKQTRFDLHIIPHTLQETHLSAIKEGARVNLEFDVLGKYVLRQFSNR